MKLSSICSKYQDINKNGLERLIGDVMAGGQRIDDHKSWMGGKGKGSPLPGGMYKVKNESSAEGAGHLSTYEDTTEAIKSAQTAGKSKLSSRGLKSGYRN